MQKKSKHQNTIEAEIRSFISPKKYKELIIFFKEKGIHKGEHKQETTYFDSKEDLRIQKTDSYSKIWLKHGNMHDDAREEIEIKIKKEDFEKAHNLFLSIGLKTQIKWLRIRNTFLWKDIKVTLDYTKGYGHIIELEKMTNIINKEKTINYLKSEFTKLNIQITPKEVFDEKFEYYKKNWKKLI